MPRSYLQRWAVGGRIRVTETMSRHSYLASPATAARETDFYRLDSPDLDPLQTPPLAFEVLLSQIEGHAVGAIDHLVAGGAPENEIEAMAYLAWYLAFQLTRGRAFREETQSILMQFTLLQHPPTEAAARRLLAQSAPDPSDQQVAEVLESLEAMHRGDLRVQHQRASVVGLAADMAGGLMPQLLFREWFVFWTPHAKLITCDEPVLVLEGPDGDRRQRGGVGTADLVVFPLAPEAILVLVHPDVDLHPFGLYPELDVNEVSSLNLELAANSHRWMFERSDRRATIGFALPPAPPSTAQEGPLPILGEPHTQLYRTFKPSRWYMHPSPPPLPVERWWWESSTRFAVPVGI